MRAVAFVILTALGCTPSAVTPDAAPPALLDGGSLRSYICPLEAGIAWTCQDGLTTPIGTCARYGCQPVP
jgi:hypothetical protein